MSPLLAQSRRAARLDERLLLGEQRTCSGNVATSAFAPKRKLGNMSTPHFALLDADDHRIWTDQRFNTRFDKARLPKPTHHLTFGKRSASAGVPVAASTADLSRGAVWAHGVGFGSRMELAEKSPSSPRKRGQLGDFIGLPTCTDHCGPWRMPTSNTHSMAATIIPSQAASSLVRMPAIKMAEITRTGRRPRSGSIPVTFLLHNAIATAHSLCPFWRNASVRRSLIASAALRPTSRPICVVCCTIPCDRSSSFCPTGRR
jgi:hypothetical protein